MVAEPEDVGTDIPDADEQNGNRLWRMQKASVPLEEAFVDETGEVIDFLPVSERVDGIARGLIQKHKLPARQVRLLLFWKRKGGTAGKRETWGKCVKLSGLAKQGWQADFVIWLAADHLGMGRITNYQLEALIYHELLHIGEELDTDGNTKAILRGHQFEGFAEELTEYGAWKYDARRMGEAFKQAPLIDNGMAP